MSNPPSTEETPLTNDTKENESKPNIDPLEKLLGLLREIELPSSEDEATSILMTELIKRGVEVEPISYRRGFKIVLAEIDDKRYAIWLRPRPISREALASVERMLRNYELDGRVLVKLSRRADYVKVKGWARVIKG